MHTKTANSAINSVVLVLLVALAGLASAQTVRLGLSMEQTLQLTPESLEIYPSLHEGRQAIGHIPSNLETLYGVGCLLEVPYIGKNRPEPFPSPGVDYVPVSVTEGTTLREFLDHACSEGQLAWGIVHNAIHIRPTTMRPGKEHYLDTVRVSLDLQGVPVLDALKAWAVAVNRNRTFPGHGVGLMHPSFGAGKGMRADRATPLSLTREGAVTLKLDNVTAREALCAIQGASKEWVRISYHHKTNFRDGVTLFASQAEMDACPEVTLEERQALDEAEDLASVLVAPAAESGGGQK